MSAEKTRQLLKIIEKQYWSQLQYELKSISFEMRHKYITRIIDRYASQIPLEAVYIFTSFDPAFICDQFALRFLIDINFDVIYFFLEKGWKPTQAIADQVKELANMQLEILQKVSPTLRDEERAKFIPLVSWFKVHHLECTIG